MIKRAISIAAILLLAILGVGIVVTKASPRVSRHEAVNRHVDVAGNDLRDLAAAHRRLDLAEVTGQRVQVDSQDASVLDDGVQGDAGREVSDRLVGEEVNTLRGGVAVDVRPALLDVNGRGDRGYLNNLRNLVDVTEHLNVYSHLAVRRLRVRVPRHLENVFSGLRPESLQMVSVFKTVKVLQEVPGDNFLAALALPAFEVPSVKAFRQAEVARVNPLVQEDTVNVTGELGELDLAVA